MSEPEDDWPSKEEFRLRNIELAIKANESRIQSLKWWACIAVIFFVIVISGLGYVIKRNERTFGLFVCGHMSADHPEAQFKCKQQDIDSLLGDK
jgi:hypothetical protein